MAKNLIGNVDNPASRFPTGRARRSVIATVALLCSSLFFLLSCDSTVTPPPPVYFRAAGSTTLQSLFIKLSETYSRAHPQVSFDVTGGGSALGLELVESGQIEMGLVSWPPQPLDSRLRLVPLGQDAIAIITHPENPLPNLPVATLRDIFNGKVLNWQVIGGSDLAVQVVSREDGSGTRSAFEAVVMDNQPVTPTAVVQPGSQAVVDYVAQNPGAVGYVSAAFADDQVHVVPLEGVLPTFEALQSRQYPLRSDLALVVAQNPPAELEEFLRFVTSPAGRQIIESWQGR